MITIGIDSSLTGTGLVVLDDDKIVEQRLIISKPTGKDPLSEMLRIMTIVEDIENSIIMFKPKLATMEGIAMGARGAITQLSGLNYLIRRMLVAHGVSFVIVAPTSLKKFVTGKGIGPKDVMMLEVYKKYGVSIPENNICDAFGLARMAYDLKNETKVTKPQQETLDLLKKQLCQ